MEKKLGLIGYGNMGSAIIGGIIKSGLIARDNIYISSGSEKSLARAREEFQVYTSLDNQEIARKSDILILAVKPNVFPQLMEEIGGVLAEDCLLVSIAAGISLAQLEAWCPSPRKLVRVMPNTPVLVGEGMSSLSFNGLVDQEEEDFILELFTSFGRAEVVDEDLIDAVIAVSGSAPAYVFMFIEALADGAVLEGMKREAAYEFAAQAVLGSAKMVLETGRHPGELKDMVCSPRGTSIEAVAELERLGMRNAIISAMRVCAEKSRRMTSSKED